MKISNLSTIIGRNSSVKELNEPPSVTFVVIAIGQKYVEMAMQLCSSINYFFVDSFELIVFTDDTERFLSLELKSVIKLVKTESFKWPEATLLRFHLISKNKELITGKYILYIDADTILKRKLNSSNLFSPELEMSFVQHPGSYQRGPLRFLYKRLVKPFWETNKISMSYVPWFRRRHYVYGGIWGGKRDEVVRMCFQLKKLIDTDLAIGFYPISYDESYLNNWVSTNKKWKLLSPRFAYAEEFPWLKSISDPFIVVVNKPSAIVNEKKKLEKNENRLK